MEEEKYRNFLDDTLRNIIDRVINININEASEFEKGVQFGYYESISHIFNQAETFGILDDLNDYLKNFNPDDLLTGKAVSPFKKTAPDEGVEKC